MSSLDVVAPVKVRDPISSLPQPVYSHFLLVVRSTKVTVGSPIFAVSSQSVTGFAGSGPSVRGLQPGSCFNPDVISPFATACKVRERHSTQLHSERALHDEMPPLGSVVHVLMASPRTSTSQPLIQSPWKP